MNPIVLAHLEEGNANSHNKSSGIPILNGKINGLSTPCSLRAYIQIDG